MLADPVKVLLDHYAPQMPVIVIAWASLTISVYAVMKPRLEMIAAIKKENTSSMSNDQRAKHENPTNPQGQGGPRPRVGSVAQGETVEFPEQIKPQKL